MVVAAQSTRRATRAPHGSLGSDSLVDRFIPTYEIAERHEVNVAAPAAVTYAAARDVDLRRSWLVRAIFTGRELLLRSHSSTSGGPPAVGLPGLLALGWGVLAEEPGREVVVGAVTRPWEADVKFQSLPPTEFVAFDRPGYAKIVWTLAADPIDASRSRFRTETRVCTTDPVSRRRFRRYWRMFSPGILLIRRAALRLVKREAERRARAPGERA